VLFREGENNLDISSYVLNFIKKCYIEQCISGNNLNTKFQIFVIMASILTMAAYCLSINTADSVITDVWTCIQPVATPNNAKCHLTRGEVDLDYDCTYDTTTKKWSCVQAKTSAGTSNQIQGSEILNKLTGPQIPFGLKTELDSVIKNKNLSLVKGTEEEQKQASNMTEIDGNHSSISKKNNKSSTLKQLNDLQVARGLH
jgi:hypothetical protein